MQTLIRGGRIVDPGKFDDIMDILIEGGKIISVTASPDEKFLAAVETKGKGTDREQGSPERRGLIGADFGFLSAWFDSPFD